MIARIQHLRARENHGPPFPAISRDIGAVESCNRVRSSRACSYDHPPPIRRQQAPPQPCFKAGSVPFDDLPPVNVSMSPPVIRRPEEIHSSHDFLLRRQMSKDRRRREFCARGPWHHIAERLAHHGRDTVPGQDTAWNHRWARALRPEGPGPCPSRANTRLDALPRVFFSCPAAQIARLSFFWSNSWAPHSHLVGRTVFARLHKLGHRSRSASVRPLAPLSPNIANAPPPHHSANLNYGSSFQLSVLPLETQTLPHCPHRGLAKPMGQRDEQVRPAPNRRPPCLNRHLHTIGFSEARLP